VPVVVWYLLSERKQKLQDREMNQKIENGGLPE
jgi:hypothetical protein